MAGSGVIVTVNQGNQEAGEGGIRFTKWLMFTVIFALAPLLANVIASENEQSFSWLAIIGKGELFVIAAGITVDGLSRVWSKRAVNGIYGTVVFGALVFVLCATSIEFGWISRNLAEQASRTDQALDAVVEGSQHRIGMENIKRIAENGKAPQTISRYQTRDSLIVFVATLVVAGTALTLEDSQ